MQQKQGFTIIEMLITLGGICILVFLAGRFLGWNGSNYKEQAYVKSLEEVILRGLNYAEKLEQPIAICFTLSEGCGAEGVLTPIDKEESGQSIREWHLLEALPPKQHILLRTNLRGDRLLILPGGKSVQQPGAIHVCAMDQELPYIWRITVSRAGKLSVKKIEGEQSLKACSQGA